jgi:hypothetical protein
MSRYADTDFVAAAGGTPLPEGWTWYTLPHYYGPHDCDMGQLSLSFNSRTTHEVAEARVKAMRDWLASMDVWFEFSGTRNFQGRPAYQFVRVNPQMPPSPDNWAACQERPCPLCDLPIDPFDALCVHCNARMECAGCHGSIAYFGVLRSGAGLSWAPEGVEPGTPWMGCNSCFGNCVHRERPEAVPGRRVRAAPYCSAMCPAGQQMCEEHTNPFTCTDCDRVQERNLYYCLEVEGGTYCEVCATRRCARCGVQREEQQRWRSIDERRVCNDCYRVANATRMEFIDREVRMTADELLIPALPDRPVRLVSIEQEFDAGDSGDPNCGTTIARQLYDAGLSCYNERMRYHSGGHSSPSHVERDASVEAGGELIYNRLKLDTPEDAQHMASICEIVQTATEAGTIGFTSKCGTHTHIDLHGYSIADARNYVTLYSYLEDVIFRLGSAGYGDHRSVVSSSGFAVPIRKDKWGNLVQFGVDFLRNANHTDSLNMQHFYASLALCTCGAIEFGNMEECTCVRPKCTAEWRVFNGTGNPRKLHAWVAFVQGLTSWCQNRELDLDEYEPLGFEREIDFTKDLGDAHNNLIDAWKPRLEWVWTNLPLTDQEKVSMMYCIKNSPLKHVGESFLMNLARVERVEEPERELELTIVATRDGSGDVMPPRAIDRLRNSQFAATPSVEYDGPDFDEEEPF